MKLLTSLGQLRTKSEPLFSGENGKTIAEYQRELLIKTGRTQFEKLKDLGLTIPVQLV
ncbi:MAG TPA: hypothetical protein VE090_05680 [Methylomirabilota bacterium]|nr:hypothetical protein [Methylomirabilota bacterium]